jgi:spore maturation protein SpmB
MSTKLTIVKATSVSAATRVDLETLVMTGEDSIREEVQSVMTSGTDATLTLLRGTPGKLKNKINK